MHEGNSRPLDRVADRKDQAIGRIIALLPLLPIKELDAMADRLRQRIREISALADSQEVDHGLPPTVIRPKPRRPAAELCKSGCVDLVGQ